MNSKAAITITYCSQCNWMLRASWMAQELLHTFSTDIASVTLVPGTGGIFPDRCRRSADLGAQAGWRFSGCGRAETPGARCLLPGEAALGHVDKGDQKG